MAAMVRGVRSWRQSALGLLVAVSLLVAVGLVSPPASEAVPASDERVAQATSYDNPLAGAQTVNPSLLKSGTQYYAYFNGVGPYNVPAYTSSDLATWTQVPGVNVLSVPAGSWADASAGNRFTSPAVVNIPGNPAGQRFVLYFTGTVAGASTKCIGAATADGPTGPFVAAADPLVCPTGGAQDPSVIYAGTSAIQLAYRANGANPGIYNQPLASSGLALASGGPYLLYRAQPTWWHEGVVERPVLVATAARTFLMFSGGPANTNKRGIGWSPCATTILLVTSCSSQTRFGTWMAGNADVAAPSGPQVLTDGSNRWLAYDARPGGSCTATSCTGTPTFRIDKLCFAHETPRTNGPTTAPQSLTRNSVCSDDIPGAAFSVASVTDTLTVSQPTTVSFRDGAQTVPIGGRALWTYSDTLTTGGCPGRTNTADLGAPAAAATGPNWAQVPASGACEPQYIPYTSDEAAYNAAHTCAGVPAPPPGQPPTCFRSRVALWTTGSTPMPDGSALVFFFKQYDTECWDAGASRVIHCFEALGVGTVRLTPASTAADRSPSVSPTACNPTCLFDAEEVDPDDNGAIYGAPLLSDGYLYVYGPAKAPPFSYHPAMVARAAVADVQNPAAWLFWDEATSSFQPTQDLADPLPNLREGNRISYNPYLDRYVNTTGGGFWDPSEFYIQTAPSPTGPWTVADDDQGVAPAFTGQTCPGGGYAYGASEHPEFAMDGSRRLAITYARPAASGCAGQIRYVELRLG